MRDFDPATLAFDFDVALHEGGLASEWSLGLRGGEIVPFLGFRRDFAIGDGVTRHFVVTDASGLPAVAAILEDIPVDHEVTLIAETRHPEDRVLLDAAFAAAERRTGPRIIERWITGRPSVGGDSPLALAALETRVPSDTQVWLAAESSTVRRIRRHVLDVCDIPRAQLHATAYWIDGLTSSDRDVREARIYGDAAAAGLDTMDPAVYDRIEFEHAGAVSADS